ncbi:uncharacterized protein STEHIDRAFT_49706 [Stereum hirsutum FP-91666 SS1]|uniref:uncharacterized protein n=1 Tax=Stereum hirsutum (strain FP-91666) TaxID=721885 RepID=UPI000440E5A5|nr:uncharacterized protein STEHIDRAFT_49706 [Stereum hirsutum FP-91666 SS1]EIM91613.1 hypothetical protein STEHIDRAFT_49706 [Stereum hirsutum FP-91666 SS1]
MTYYASPAAANYYTPPPHVVRQRATRMCDQCGAIEQPAIKQFRLCGGCMTTNYCSQECQKIHWPSHKAICKHTVAQVAAMKQQPRSVDYGDQNLSKMLRKFTSFHQNLLQWCGFQALQLKRLPSNIRQNALLIELTYRPTGDSHRQFAVSGTHIVPRTFVTSQDPLVAADIQRREDRCRRNGGIGCCVVLIQCDGINQVMPVEVDPPASIAWDIRDDWEDVLEHFVDSGRPDFKPICTTPMG